MNEPTETHPLKHITRSGTTEGGRMLASEMPLSLTYNGIAYAVMMVTAKDLEDFAVGFSFSEQIIQRLEDILGIDIRPITPGFLARIDIPAERQKTLLLGRRNLVGQTGCGLCGVVELEGAIRPLAPLTLKPRVDHAAIFNALDNLSRLQPLNQLTGSVHAAAFANADGSLSLAREDVGRHNAFDKLMGAMLRKGLSPYNGFVVLTSRCSFELVQKAVVFGVPLLVTISAPTTLAVNLARDAGLTLVALARADSLLCFSDPHAIFGITEQISDV